ncbi:MAG: hypothetical protein LBT56_00075 [Prevotellaceae bacterium]|jgi:hypothetical protein|nr:hypothetical protein [Prevotellaceae bacterium]
MTTKTTNKKGISTDKFFKENPKIKTVYVDENGNIYLSYNAKTDLKKVTRNE